MRQQQHYKDLSHAEIKALIQAHGQIKKPVTRSIQINLVEQGQKKGWNALTAEVNALSTTLRSVEDLKFSVEKYLNKSELKMA